MDIEHKTRFERSKRETVVEPCMSLQVLPGLPEKQGEYYVDVDDRNHMTVYTNSAWIREFLRSNVRHGMPAIAAIRMLDREAFRRSQVAK